jgi:DNA-binding NarL/FixJ family response regulator
MSVYFATTYMNIERKRKEIPSGLMDEVEDATEDGVEVESELDYCDRLVNDSVSPSVKKVYWLLKSGYSVRDIAEILDASIMCVSSQVTKLRALLQKGKRNEDRQPQYAS